MEPQVEWQARHFQYLVVLVVEVVEVEEEHFHLNQQQLLEHLSLNFDLNYLEHFELDWSL